MSEVPRTYYEEEPTDHERSQPSPGSVETIELNQSKMYDYLEEEIGLNKDTLPVDTIYDYFNKLELEAPELIAFNANSHTLDILGSVLPAAANGLKDPSILGAYDPSGDIAFIATNHTDSRLEKIATAVHELAHGAGMKAYKITKLDPSSVEYSATRSGYAVESTGEKEGRNAIFDEGRAELLAAHFVRREHAAEAEAPDIKFHDTWISSSYQRRSRDGSLLHITSRAPAAISLELLIAKNPRLLPLIVKGPSSVEGLRQTAQELDQLSDGLYTRLSKLPEEYDEFNTMVHTIIHDFYDDDETAPLKAHAYVGQLLDDLLSKKEPQTRTARLLKKFRLPKSAR